jgi:hypothetical protein
MLSIFGPLAAGPMPRLQVERRRQPASAQDFILLHIGE